VGGDLSAFGNPFAEAAVCAFMLLFGANFSLYFQAFSKRDARAFLRDEELRFYLGAIAAATGLIATANALAGVFPSALESLRQAAFHTVSVITTTGFTTTDYGAWPTFSQALLILLMFVGAMGGSTGGGIKCVRVLLLVKIARREVRRIIHPRSVKALRLNGKAVEEGVLSSIVVFFFLYMAILGVAVLLVSAEGGGLLTAMTAVLACLSNIGPGSGVVGFEGSFAAFSGFGKGVLSFCMFVGRLEIYPVLLLASPAFWKKVNI
jgi:trk system potassium uptake protein TrkH